MVSTHATHKGKILQIRKKEEYEVNKVYPRRADDEEVTIKVLKDHKQGS